MRKMIVLAVMLALAALMMTAAPAMAATNNDVRTDRADLRADRAELTPSAADIRADRADLRADQRGNNSCWWDGCFTNNSCWWDGCFNSCWWDGCFTNSNVAQQALLVAEEPDFVSFDNANSCWFWNGWNWVSVCSPANTVTPVTIVNSGTIY